MRKRTPAPCLVERCTRINDGERGYCSPHYQKLRKYGDPLGGRFECGVGYEARLQQHSDRSGGPDACWPWAGVIDRYGYGRINLTGAPTHTAHRLAYFVWVGPVTADLTIDHLCHDPDYCSAGNECPHRRCINPRHLAAVSSATNTRRGGSRHAQNRRKTHCVRSHPFDETNTALDSSGFRVCLQCQRDKNARRKKERAEARAKRVPVVKLCAVDTCGRSSRARGWCDSHYARWRKTGSVVLPGGVEVLSPPNGEKTRCKRGHLLVGANVRFMPNGRGRSCRVCAGSVRPA